MLDLSFRLRTFDDLTVDELYRIFRLRVEVFIVEQDCPYQDVDDLDRQAIHLLGETPSGELVAYARLLPRGLAYPDAAAIGRVVTSKAARGTGAGLRMMREAIERCRERFGADVDIRLGAQDYAIPFYRRLGFEPIGEGYLEDGIPHTTMVLAN
jgi:ElaA protein